MVTVPYGGKIAAVHKYQLPDRGTLNIKYTELRVRTKVVLLPNLVFI